MPSKQSRIVIITFFLILILPLLIPSVSAQIASFTAPDTVCAGSLINITNQSTTGQNYYWSFCSGNTLSNPVGENIGNPGGLLDVPVYITLVN
ncbi:MAG: hypothetical protein WCI71_13775, partial [Bacteroidota bacterium]